MPTPSIAIVAERPCHQATARQLAQAWGVPVLPHPHDTTAREPAFILHCSDDGLTVIPCGPGAPGPIRATFTDGAVAHRQRFGGGTGQLIAKAVGCRGNLRPSVLDVTAGLGRDGFVLASLGCPVTLVERSPIVHALLADGLQRAQDDAHAGPVVARMQLHHADGAAWLAQHPAQAEVVYVDPMFPERTKSAQVKKEMRLFHDLVGDDADADALLAAALDYGAARVVVKRSRRAPLLGTRPPSHQLLGKSSRYDVYVSRGIVGT